VPAAISFRPRKRNLPVRAIRPSGDRGDGARARSPCFSDSRPPMSLVRRGSLATACSGHRVPAESIMAPSTGMGSEVMGSPFSTTTTRGSDAYLVRRGRFRRRESLAPNRLFQQNHGKFTVTAGRAGRHGRTGVSVGISTTTDSSTCSSQLQPEQPVPQPKREFRKRHNEGGNPGKCWSESSCSATTIPTVPGSHFVELPEGRSRECACKGWGPDYCSPQSLPTARTPLTTTTETGLRRCHRAAGIASALPGLGVVCSGFTGDGGWILRGERRRANASG
jgi:hypothetical protein